MMNKKTKSFNHKVGLCDNTDCPDQNKKVRIYPVELKEDFDDEGGTSWWCKECIIRDKEMLNFNPLQ